MSKTETTDLHRVEFIEPILAQIPRMQLSISDTALALDVPLSTLEQECRKGRGPTFYSVGRRRYTTPNLIREWQSAKIAEAVNEKPAP